MFRRTMIIGTALSTGLSLAALPATPAAGQDSPWRVVASGLDSPRGLAFGPNGTLYVAEAGVGGTSPCLPHPLGQICYGATGAVTEVKRGHQNRVLTGLPSFALQGTPEVFGPSDVALNGSGNLYVTLGLGDDPALRTALPPEGQTAATLVRAKPSKGTFRLVADIGGFELSDNPDGGLPDSNPQGLLSTQRPGGRGRRRQLPPGCAPTRTHLNPRGVPTATGAQPVRWPRHPDAGRADDSDPRPGRRAVRRSAHRVPLPGRRRERLPGRAGRTTRGVRQRVHEHHRHRLRSRPLALRAGDRAQRPAVR